jgi:hypothetical protein
MNSRRNRRSFRPTFDLMPTRIAPTTGITFDPITIPPDLAPEFPGGPVIIAPSPSPIAASPFLAPLAPLIPTSADTGVSVGY